MGCCPHRRTRMNERLLAAREALVVTPEPEEPTIKVSPEPHPDLEIVIRRSKRFEQEK